ncbi:MAG: iron-sulfur cluster assembly accessory protein [Magnetococcales bacterium]|nr:iron-sulfur cluster assembly accessory protein [Magnetococcales bacterium]
MDEGFKGITLTELAAEKVHGMLAKRGTPNAAVRLGVTSSGCSGLSYKLEYADQLEESDKVFEQHGVRLVIDEKSLLTMDGTQMDFETKQFKSGFKFTNPKMKEECGCGESFKV